MTHFRKLNDHELDSTTKIFVRQEREATGNVLHCLRENERRRLFSSLGFKSLFDYAVRGLQYTEDQAWRRISAMRMLKEIPEIEEKIENGSLTLTHLNLAQKLFRQEEDLTKSEKIEIFEKLENTTKREAEKILVAASTVPFQKVETIKMVAQETIEIRFTADAKLEAKLQKLKGLLAHKHPNIPMAELVDKLCDLAIEKWDPAEQKTTRRNNAVVPAPARMSSQLRPAISVALKRAVWRRDNSRCKLCGSVHALEVDHIQPIAMGGSNEFGNLRLLCRSCNQRSAIKTFGAGQMQRYFES